MDADDRRRLAAAADEAPAGVRMKGDDISHGTALARGALFSGAALLTSLLRAFFGLLVARLLGSAVLGVYVVAWATTDLVSKFTVFGLETTVTTAIARSEAAGDRASSAHLMHVAVAIGLTLSTLAALVGFGSFGSLAAAIGQRPELGRATAVALLALPGLALYRISNAVSRGMAVMHHDIYSRGLADSLGTIAALLVAMWLGGRMLAPPIAAVLGVSAAGIVAYASARRLFAGIDRRMAATDGSPRMIRESFAVCLYDFFNIGLMQVDVLMLGLLIGRAPGVTLTSVGIYAAAAEAASGLRRVSQIFSPIFMTLVARKLADRNIRLAESMYGLVARWMVAILIPAVMVFIMAGRSIMAIFGQDFGPGTPWLAIVAVGFASHAFAGLAEPVLMVERPSLNLVNVLVATAATVASNLALISRFGPIGAAVGTIVTSVTYGILRSIEISWLTGWRWPWSALRKPAAAALLALPVALAVRALGSSPMMQVLAAASYVLGNAMAWRWLGLDDADRQIVAQLLGGQRAERQGPRSSAGQDDANG